MAMFSSVSQCMILLLSFFFFTCFSLDDSSSLPLTLTSLSSKSPSSIHVKSSLKYSLPLVVTLPIGTPPQPQQMILDTRSQLPRIKCSDKKNPQKGMFDPSRSSSFATIPCNVPLCQPPIPDFSFITECDENKLCNYSFSYADGTLAKGNLVKEKISFSTSQVPIVLGCAAEPQDAMGTLGMNLGVHSFPSQAKINKFSYCVPLKQSQPTSGSFYFGKNPASFFFHYVNLLTFNETLSQSMPNLDPLAYTVPMQGISIGGKKLNIPPSVFKPDASGLGQTMIDSGSELSYFVDKAYNVIREELVKKVGKIKKNYMYNGVADICFDGDAIEIRRLIGDMVFEFEKCVEIMIPQERVVIEVERGVQCLAIGSVERLGIIGKNIIGNFHLQNQWVEFDIANRRVGFGDAPDCNKKVQ